MKMKRGGVLVLLVILCSYRSVDSLVTCDYGSLSRLGFECECELGWYGARCSVPVCGGQVSEVALTEFSTQVVFASSANGVPLQSNSTCMWRVSGPPGSALSVLFDSVYSVSGNDEVTIVSGLSTERGAVVARMSSPTQLLNGPVVVEGNQVVVIITTGLAPFNRYFQFSVTSSPRIFALPWFTVEYPPPPRACGECLNDRECVDDRCMCFDDEFPPYCSPNCAGLQYLPDPQSPWGNIIRNSFKGYYSPRAVCGWTIDGASVTLNFRSFMTESLVDFLYVYERGDQIYASLSGNIEPFSVTLCGPVVLAFSSDASLQMPGFVLEFESNSIPCESSAPFDLELIEDNTYQSILSITNNIYQVVFISSGPFFILGALWFVSIGRSIDVRAVLESMRPHKGLSLDKSAMELVSLDAGGLGLHNRDEIQRRVDDDVEVQKKVMSVVIAANPSIDPTQQTRMTAVATPTYFFVDSAEESSLGEVRRAKEKSLLRRMARQQARARMNKAVSSSESESVEAMNASVSKAQVKAHGDKSSSLSAYS